MATSKRKIYGNMRIMAIEGKDVLIGKTATAKKNGKLNPDAVFPIKMSFPSIAIIRIFP